MKWGRKRFSPSSSPTSIITRVFPVSWFSKFKQKGGSPEAKSEKKQQRRNSSGWREARIYDDDDGAYWRLSFRKERSHGGSRGGVGPFWCDSDGEFQVPFSGLKSFGLRETEVPGREDNMVLANRKMKEKKYKENILPKNGAFRRKKPNVGELVTLWRKDGNDRRTRKLRRKRKAGLERGTDSGEDKSLRPEEEDIFPVVEPEKIYQMKAASKSRNKQNISCQYFTMSTVEEDYAYAAVNGERSNTTETQWKSAYISRDSHNRKIKQNKTKAYCPKTECRIKVFQDKKKARMKSKKRETKEQVKDSRSTFDGFAVVKSSFNPQQDFRDSMHEMIIDKGIRLPEELKELLACYLTMNSDKYQNLIIKVFQQVWLELSGGVY